MKGNMMGDISEVSFTLNILNTSFSAKHYSGIEGSVTFSSVWRDKLVVLEYGKKMLLLQTSVPL